MDGEPGLEPKMEAGADAGLSKAGGPGRSQAPWWLWGWGFRMSGVRLAVCNRGLARRPEVGEGIVMPPTTPAGPDTPGRRARSPGGVRLRPRPGSRTRP